MIIAYHAIFTTYGTWLPNDPRGSYSKVIYNEELRALGQVKYGRQDPQPDRGSLRRFWTAAAPQLSRPPYFINSATRPVIARGFAQVKRRLDLTVRACSIMNDHVHMIVARSRYRIEYLVNQFKGAATKQLKVKRTPWARGRWKVYINDQETLIAAIEYVEANPVCAGLSPQHWDFVAPPL